MRKTILVLACSFLTGILCAQQKENAEKLVSEGVAYHDKGDYEGAISKYDKALELDKDNLLAIAEKAFSLLSLQKYEESIACCQKALQTHPGENNLKSVYVTYGNALDGLKKTDQSIEVYDQGIKQFPDYYQLYFNKGISLTSVKRYDEALAAVEKAVMANPRHASSHNVIARISFINSKRIPAVLAYCRFLVVEPNSERAKENLANLQTIIKGNAEKTGKKSITVNISADMLADTAVNGKVKENSFTSTDLILAMDAAMDFEKKNRKKTEAEQFLRKFETVCASLKETQKNNYGFFWDYYVPYFVEMKDKNLLETFSYIAFASSGDADVAKWLKSHKDDVEKFYTWSKSFAWKTQ